LKWPPILWFFFQISASTEWANRQFHISSRGGSCKEVNIHFGIRWILKIQELALGLRYKRPKFEVVLNL
jgi:hypothetical protein